MPTGAVATASAAFLAMAFLMVATPLW